MYDIRVKARYSATRTQRLLQSVKEIPCYTAFIVTTVFDRTATNCGGKTVVLYRGLTIHWLAGNKFLTLQVCDPFTSLETENSFF